MIAIWPEISIREDFFWKQKDYIEEIILRCFFELDKAKGIYTLHQMSFGINHSEEKNIKISQYIHEFRQKTLKYKENTIYDSTIIDMEGKPIFFTLDELIRKFILPIR